MPLKRQRQPSDAAFSKALPINVSQVEMKWFRSKVLSAPRDLNRLIQEWIRPLYFWTSKSLSWLLHIKPHLLQCISWNSIPSNIDITVTLKSSAKFCSSVKLLKGVKTVFLSQSHRYQGGSFCSGPVLLLLKIKKKNKQKNFRTAEKSHEGQKPAPSCRGTTRVWNKMVFLFIESILPFSLTKKV